MEKADIIVAVPLDVFDDLMSMARRSDQYRKGYAWTAVAMSKANHLANNAMVRRYGRGVLPKYLQEE